MKAVVVTAESASGGEPTALESTARALLAPGKGILAADESLPTIGKRFAQLGIPSTADNRRAYRELLITTPDLGEFISGVILFDETIRQMCSGGESMVEVLSRQGILAGIKVDQGTTAFAGLADEKLTRGLDGLSDRLEQYRGLGARFTKWRAVIAIGERLPMAACIEANARGLARFAELSQSAGMVPIVEPEVLMDGDHTLSRAEEVTAATLKAVFAALDEHRVALDSILLKTGMVVPGKDCPEQADAETVAAATLRCLRGVVPDAVAGIVFLSGGQSDVAATERLNAICRSGPNPWTLSFSFGRALQDAAMRTWIGSSANIAGAQAALYHRAMCNSLATRGKYTEQGEREGARRAPSIQGEAPIASMEAKH